MTRHVLITNDYPPKVGGIQSYLWELYRRLPQESVAVFTSPHEKSAVFDSEQDHRIERHDRFWLTPTPDVRRGVERLVESHGAQFVMIDPAVPLGLLGRSLSVPYGLIVHGTEATIPAQIPGLRSLQGRALRDAATLVSSSQWATDELADAFGAATNELYLPPGVDHTRFAPVSAEERSAIRRRFGITPDALVIVSLSRLVKRKGMDRVIEATAQLRVSHPDLQTIIVGAGRDEQRLRSLAQKSRAPVRFLGRVPHGDIASLHACADVFAMMCRNQWNGLEQEGFGIVFLEAAAAGVPVVAGNSGGSAEAVDHGVTGTVVADPDSVDSVAAALGELLGSAETRRRFGRAGRARVLDHFSWDSLAMQYSDHLEETFHA